MVITINVIGNHDDTYIDYYTTSLPSTQLPEDESRSILLCRYNVHKYFNELDSEFIKLIPTPNYENFIENMSILPNTTLVISDDPFSSCCKSVKNSDNFLDDPNVSLCIAENWYDNAHHKLFIWPIGLESKMCKDKELTKMFTQTAINHNPDKNGLVLSNSHLVTYPIPASGYRDDRGEMIESLQYSSNIDFWPKGKPQKQTLTETPLYTYSLCPEGNGLDTHRFYETYAMGVHPIVRKGPLTPLHTQFPNTIVVDDWEEVTNLPVIYTVPKPDLEYITLGHWLYKALRPRCRIVNFFTGGLCEEWRNFLYTVRQQGLEDLLVVFVLDQQALECVKKEGISYRTDLMTKDLTKESDFGSEGFRDITARKVKAIEIMLREGYFVFYLDTDIVLLDNPVRHYFTLPAAPVYMQSDTTNFNINTPGEHCTGVIFMSPSLKTADIMNKASNLILGLPPGKLDDQNILNKTLKARTLDPKAYPNGHRYFKHKDRCWNKPILIHNNYIIGLDAKIDRFKKHGLWYI
jgi:hypothetical protein